MTILNLHWGFATGGIGKCFLTYDKIGEKDERLKVVSVCVVVTSHNWDLQPLYNQNIIVIKIKSNWDFSWMKPLKKIVDENKIDCFFSHSHNGPIMLSLFRLRYNLSIPLISTCHGYNPATIFQKITARMLLQIMKSNWSKKVICVEQFTPPILVRHGVCKDKIVTIYNGLSPSVDSNIIDCIRKDNTAIIISASRITRIKGINFLLDALSILDKKGLNFHYYCIGDGEEEVSLKKQCNNLMLNNKVTFVGYQNNIPDWLASCDIFVLPSLEEYHSIAILEAMRANKAIVATNIGGNPESLLDGKDALLVPSMDSKALADALEQVLVSSDLREQLGSSARKRFLDCFTEDKMKENLAREIYNTRIN